VTKSTERSTCDVHVFYHFPIIFLDEESSFYNFLYTSQVNFQSNFRNMFFRGGKKIFAVCLVAAAMAINCAHIEAAASFGSGVVTQSGIGGSKTTQSSGKNVSSGGKTSSGKPCVSTRTNGVKTTHSTVRSSTKYSMGSKTTRNSVKKPCNTVKSQGKSVQKEATVKAPVKKAPVKKAPVKAPIKKAPVKAPINKAPVKKTPAVQTEQIAPTKQTKQIAPAVQTEQIAPAVQTEQIAPAVQTEQIAPAVQTEQIAPAVQTEQVAQIEQTAPSQQSDVAPTDTSVDTDALLASGTYIAPITSRKLRVAVGAN
jgi:hypothetical protein